MSDSTVLSDEHRGLYGKYNVTKASTGESVSDCIVLRPGRDRAAWHALMLYAELIQHDYYHFASDLNEWLLDLDRSKS